MAKKETPISSVLVEICMKKARKSQQPDCFPLEINRRLAKAIRADVKDDKALLATELCKLAGVALAAAEYAYNGSTYNGRAGISFHLGGS